MGSNDQVSLIDNQGSNTTFILSNAINVPQEKKKFLHIWQILLHGFANELHEFSSRVATESVE